MTKAIKQTGDQLKVAVSDDKTRMCQRCGNIYTLIWLKPGDDYNDFSLRSCPFCGLLTDELLEVKLPEAQRRPIGIKAQIKIY